MQTPSPRELAAALRLWRARKEQREQQRGEEKLHKPVDAPEGCD